MLDFIIDRLGDLAEFFIYLWSEKVFKKPFSFFIYTGCATGGRKYSQHENAVILSARIVKPIPDERIKPFKICL